MDKRSIVVLVIAGALYLGSLGLYEVANSIENDQKYRDVSQQKFWMGFRSENEREYYNAETTKINYSRQGAKWSERLAILMGIAGSLWLIVSVIQKKKKEE
jgi:uncharacterized membrane protein YuzA (DUF378 family)